MTKPDDIMSYLPVFLIAFEDAVLTYVLTSCISLSTKLLSRPFLSATLDSVNAIS